MISVDCFVGRLRETLRDAGTTMEDLGAEIEQGFAIGSAGNLQVRFNDSRLNVLNLAPSRLTDTWNLQESLRLLISNQPTGPTRRVGLILADRWDPRDTVFGIMFDESFMGEDGPREGCAVFLDRIFADRIGDGHDDDAYAREVRFTAMHELGHVFNLWHQDTPTSYLSRSGGRAFPQDLHEFNEHHQEYLRLDSPESRPHLEPAGSAFGDRPNGFPPGKDPLHGKNEPVLGGGAELRISGPSRPFWYFEPIELEVTLRATGGRSSTWPDEIDPGYGSFTIWIEEPSGERRRYRSVKHFANNVARLRIQPRRPFTRDISIFAESGGYTFRDVGVHRVWATFDASRSRRLRSNTIELELKPQKPEQDRFRQLQATLTHSSVASLLYYRSGKVTAPDQRAVAHVLSLFPNTVSAAGLRYAIGRHLGSRALRNPRGQRSQRAVAIDYLSRSANSAALNAHRRAKATDLVEQLKQL